MISLSEHGPVYLVDTESEGLEHGPDKVGSCGGCTQTQKAPSGCGIIHRSLKGGRELKMLLA